MSKTTSVFYPRYELRNQECGLKEFGKTKFTFDFEGKPFSTRIPMFGITETQKVVLRNMWWEKTPPVMSISHEKPGVPDKRAFRDPEELHTTYNPYAMSIATVQCLGEVKLRKVKVYFCNIELHEGATWNTPATHSKFKGTFVVSL